MKEPIERENEGLKLENSYPISEGVEKIIKQRISNPKEQEATRGALIFLSQKIGEVKYDEVCGMEIKNGGITLLIEYRTSAYFSDEEQKRFFLEISHLILKIDDYEINIMDIMPEDCRALFDPKSNDLEKSGEYPEEKIVTVYGDITEPKVILALLHEIGHIHAEPEKYGKPFRKTNTNQEIVLSERKAWAFALRIIKPFLRQENLFNKQAINKFKNLSLDCVKEHI